MEYIKLLYKFFSFLKISLATNIGTFIVLFVIKISSKIYLAHNFVRMINILNKLFLYKFEKLILCKSIFPSKNTLYVSCAYDCLLLLYDLSIRRHDLVKAMVKCKTDCYYYSFS